MNIPPWLDALITTIAEAFELFLTVLFVILFSPLGLYSYFRFKYIYSKIKWSRERLSENPHFILQHFSYYSHPTTKDVLKINHLDLDFVPEMEIHLDQHYRLLARRGEHKSLLVEMDISEKELLSNLFILEHFLNHLPYVGVGTFLIEYDRTKEQPWTVAPELMSFIIHGSGKILGSLLDG